MKEKISFQDRLLYATTIALIISNIATLVLAFTFAKALSRNIDATLRLNKAEAGPTQSIPLRKRTIEGGYDASDLGLGRDTCTFTGRGGSGCDTGYAQCTGNCSSQFPQGSGDAITCNSCCEYWWHNCLAGGSGQPY